MSVEFVFNDAQKRVIDAGVRHLLRSDGEQVFEFSGKAGTGKSVVMYEIFRLSGLPMQTIAPMAYIGQAAIVMRLKGFPAARTIHSWRYVTDIAPKENNGAYKVNEYLGAVETGLKFTLKPLPGINAFFIDEGGSVPLSLKNDLLIDGKKLVVAGDLNQLPPVMDKPAFLTDPSKVMILDQVMRQKEGSGILYIGELALSGQPIPNGFYGDALVIYEDELTNDLLKGADMILCHTNNTRDRYTHILREEIYGIKSKFPVVGEKIICRKNDWSIDVNGIGLGNGLIGTVVTPPEISSYDGEIFLLDFLPDLFDGVFYNLDVNYKYLISDVQERKRLKSNPYLKGHLFEYSYANTVHLTQGGQYGKVIYIEENCARTEFEQRQLNYTACTRAVDQLIYVKKRYRKYYT